MRLSEFEKQGAWSLGAVRAAAALILVLAWVPDTSAQLLIKPDNQWRYSLGVGGSISSGNSSSKSVNVMVDALKATDHDKWILNARMLYGESDDETTDNQVSVGGRYVRDLSERQFGFGNLEWLRDRPANLSARWSANSGVGYHVYKEVRGFWDIFTGLGYTHDSLIAPKQVSDRIRSSYGRVELLLGEESQYRLTESTTLKQRFVIYPNLEDTSSFRSVFDSSLAVAMNNRYSLTASLGYRYNSEPGADLQKFDLLFVTGISVKMQ